MIDRAKLKVALDEMLKYYDAQLNWEGTDVWANELLTLIQGGEPVALAAVNFLGEIRAVCFQPERMEPFRNHWADQEARSGPDARFPVRPLIYGDLAPQPDREREAMEGWVHRLRRLVEGLGEDYDELLKRVDEIDDILKGGPEDE